MIGIVFEMQAFRLLDRYVLRLILPPFCFGLVLFSGLAVLTGVLPRLQWVVGTPVLEMFGWFATLLPSIVVQTIPASLVLAVLLGVGRLATDNELLAVQAGGISFWRLVLISLLLAVACTFSSVALNEWVVPRANKASATNYWTLTGGGSGLFRLARQNIPIGEFSFHFDSIDRGSQMLKEVRVERWDGQQLTIVFASKARLEEAGLRLFDYKAIIVDFSVLENTTDDPQSVIRDLIPAYNRPEFSDQSLLLTAEMDLDDLVSRFGRGGFEDSRSISELRGSLFDSNLNYNEKRRAIVLFHRKLAEAVANFTLLLVALPLSILYGRSRSVGFGLSLVLIISWYLLLTLGQLLSQTGVLPVWVGLWFGNTVLGAVGLYLLGTRFSFR